MKVKVRTMRHEGRNLNRDDLKKLPPRVGELRVLEERDPALGRQVLRARLLDMTRGTEHDILPGLMDARLVWAADGKMTLIGTERLDRAEYGQTWSVEVG
ncbi:hypothetical protein [Caenimonas sp. SL110]|uniref:hypothetical protein n=1 Tax=Caenimonas sp. SL110 TaxID=1450524 RepID=UPI0009E485AF|nr:hypothetical protein [Caenimonas sp. SL110]